MNNFLSWKIRMKPLGNLLVSRAEELRVFL